MSYPPPIYPPIPTNAAWTVAFLEDTHGRPDMAVPQTVIIHDEMFTDSATALITNDASMTANRLQKAQSDTAWPIVSPLTYSAGQCSMFATRSSLGTHISLGDTRFINPTENNHNLSALAIELSHSVPSVPIPAQKESYMVATSSNIFDPLSVHDSPVPSPPRSPHLSSSQSSVETSQNKASLPDSMPSSPAVSSSPNVPEPSSAYDLASSSSPPNSNPAKMFSSSPFASSQSSLLAPNSDTTEKNVPATYHQSMLDSTDIVHAHTPRSSPYQIVSLSPTLPSSSPQEPLTSSPYFSHNIEPNPKSPHDENWVEVREGVVPSLKRMRSLSPEDSAMEVSSPSSSLTDKTAEKEEETPATKRIKLTKTMIIPPPPAQKRPTFASQKLQHKKLATPFRSPLMKKTISSENNAPNSLVAGSKSTDLSIPLPNLKLEPEPSNQLPTTLVSAIPSPVPDPPKKPKKFTPKAASQFKSPFSGPTPAALTSVRLTPTIQALERKVQILKRAMKVKIDGEEEVLGKLVKKWTDAGREVAWEVWGLVKDSGGDGGSVGAGGGATGGGWGEERRGGTKRGFEEGWGWDDKDAKKTKMGDGPERNWGWNVEREDQVEAARSDSGYDEHEGDGIKGRMRKGLEYEEDDEEKREDTLGTMLRQLGIAPETFGWNEDEGEFVGE